MYGNFVPVALREQAEGLIRELKLFSEKPAQCPYCQYDQLYAVNSLSGYYRCKSCKRGFNRSLNAPFYRLAPLELLPQIAEYRLSGLSYTTICQELISYSSWIIKRRVQVIEQFMQVRYPDLYQWYYPFITGAQQTIPETVEKQLSQLKSWFHHLLHSTTAKCPHCGSDLCQPVANSQRAQFRCKSCWRYFSYLKGTGLEHMGFVEHWDSMVDLLVVGKNNYQISQQFKISIATVSKAKRNWLMIMQQQNLLILKEWVASR